MDGALDQVVQWLNQPAELASARQKGLDLVAQSRGAAKRYAQALASLV
jgi:3-deoxy-D-manno-octulosonic-acid transferase